MLQEQLKKDPNDPLKKYWVVFAQGRSAAWDLEQTFNKQRGIAVVDARQRALENLR